MKRIVLAALCSTAIVPAVNAADLAASAPVYTKAPVVETQIYNWTGFYIGGNLGYAHNDIKSTDRSFTADPTHTALGPDLALIGIGASTIPADDASSSGGGFTGGGQIGYNYQLGQTVLGVEGDFNYISAKAADSQAVEFDGLGSVNASISLKADWFATVRGRVGYSFGAFMPYITGGVAFLHTNVDLSVNGALAGGFASVSYNASESKTLVGYAVGAGGEYALGQNWSIRGEYLHMGFGDQNYDVASGMNLNIPLLAPLGLGSVNFPAPGHERVTMNYDIVRVGLNYRFH